MCKVFCIIFVVQLWGSIILWSSHSGVAMIHSPILSVFVALFPPPGGYASWKASTHMSPWRRKSWTRAVVLQGRTTTSRTLRSLPMSLCWRSLESLRCLSGSWSGLLGRRKSTQLSTWRPTNQYILWTTSSKRGLCGWASVGILALCVAIEVPYIGLQW